jgi:hypothetical protein
MPRTAGMCSGRLERPEDSHRHVGDIEAAIDAYLKAAEIVERDFLLGTGTTADRVLRAYYYTILE